MFHINLKWGGLIMKKLPKLFVSVFASIILSLTSARALISIPDVETLQNEDTMFELINDISEEYKRTKNCKLSKELSELRAQISQICADLLRGYGVTSVASFVIPLKLALEGETGRPSLESLKSINWSTFLIVNDYKSQKLYLALGERSSGLDPSPHNLVLLI